MSLKKEKKCTKCQIKKELKEFHKVKKHKDSLSYYCKDCCRPIGVIKKKFLTDEERRLSQKKYNKTYYKKHKKECNERSKKYRVYNKEKLKKYFKEYNILNREKIYKRRHNYKKRLRNYYKTRRQNDLNFRLAGNIRSRLNKILRKSIKVGSGIKDLGCTLDELKQYIESKFELNMSWDNYGHGENKWNIDHIKPLIKFNLTNREEFLKANNYQNLQPMWHKDNIRKNSKWEK